MRLLQNKLFKLLPIILLLTIYSFYVGLTHDDFGTTWDENDVYASGALLYSHLLSPAVDSAQEIVIKTPGVEFRAMYNHLYASVLFILNAAHSYEKYHMLNMLFASISLVAAYVVLSKKYGSPYLAIVGPLFLVLTPRFFGDFASNPKDMPFAVLYFVSIVAIYFSSDIKNPMVKVLLFGIMFGLLQSMRVVALTIYPIFLIYGLYEYVRNTQNVSAKSLSAKKIASFIFTHSLMLLIIGIIALFIFTVTWPYIGSNFLKHFLEVLRSTTNYPWVGKMLFNGSFVWSNNLPWNYLPIWLIITTPIFIMGLALFGVVRAFRTNFKDPLIFLLFITLFINFALFFIARPVIYDGPRHFMFTLPLIALIASVVCIEFIQHITRVRSIVLMAVAVNMCAVVVSYFQLHPYEYVYFNEIVGGLPGAYGKFETDYWGASFREAALWLKEHKPDRDISVFTCAHSFISKYYFDESMHWTDNRETADYNICYTRNTDHTKLPGKIVYVVERQGVPLNFVRERDLSQ